ncbi:XPG i-region domain-containing protein [Sarocladium implicatum]|nr:XPG i-region domain-containing protein [Sarocladium implicatum]
MGVNGLWTVIQPCARPTNLATLNRKRLAVDASIWIYQFLKAVRDKEGNALRNSHVVGFFRRICKLLWFGIQPVFVFDGGAPALKRATIQGRQRRREGRREDAVRTAGKLLAVQMQRIAEEEEERRKKEGSDIAAREAELQHEEAPDPANVVYVDEIGMSQKERQQNRSFRKQDAYHLPELDGGIAAMGNPDDPRIMSVQELEDYARQFNNGEDVNLYDFSKIDFDGEFFKSLPPADRYNILNAARLRSRLRMGYSKDQLDDMFRDRMAFSRFQIERVKERNHLTQRLMREAGMTGLDLTVGGGGINRVAGEKDREYILVKNEGVEGGWALGVVSKDKDVGQEHKPIDVDEIHMQFQTKDEEEDEDDYDFEDIPIEGLNRLPKPTSSASAMAQASQPLASRPYKVQNAPQEAPDEDSLFVGGNAMDTDDNKQGAEEPIHPDEQDELNEAIALSLRNQHGQDSAESDDDEVFEDVEAPAPVWKQKAADSGPKPFASDQGGMIAHIVNNRSNAAVPKRQEDTSELLKPQPAAADDDSDSDLDMQAVLAKSRKMKRKQPAPVVENKKNPFDGPLPFPKLNWGSSLFSAGKAKPAGETRTGEVDPIANDSGDDAGGFEKPDDDKPKPLPPWMVDDTDIRESLRKQQDIDREINLEDRLEAEEEERLMRREGRGGIVEIEDDSGNESDVMIVEAPSQEKPKTGKAATVVDSGTELQAGSERDPETAVSDLESGFVEVSVEPTTEAVNQDQISLPKKSATPEMREPSPSEEPEMEDVALPPAEVAGLTRVQPSESPELVFEDVVPTEKVNVDATDGEASLKTPVPEVQVAISNEAPPLTTGDATIAAAAPEDAEQDPFDSDVEYDEFSDPGDEELLHSLAEEAEEHARFASELNQKSARQNQEEYEKELRQLRSQQKKDRRDADEVSQVMVSECQALLRLFGIPYITAPMEAEAQCAELVKLGLVDGIVTDDSDTFLFGGTRVYKNMFNSNKFVECYIGSDLEKELSLSREQLISLAQLLGSDYTDGLQGVGPVTAVEILSEFPGKDGLEHFRAWWQSVQSQTRPKEADADSTFRRKFRKSQAAKLFLPTTFPNAAVYDAYLNPDVDSNAESFQWGVPDVEGLRNFLMATIGWSKDRTDEVLVPVIRDMNKRAAEGTQSNITRFFGGGVGAGAREAWAPSERMRGTGSRRMAAAVDRLRENVGTGKRKRSDAAAAENSERQVETEGVEEHDKGDKDAAATTRRGKGRRTKAS